jgi:hypothetical protein
MKNHTIRTLAELQQLERAAAAAYSEHMLANGDTMHARFAAQAVFARAVEVEDEAEAAYVAAEEAYKAWEAADAAMRAAYFSYEAARDKATRLSGQTRRK